MKRFYFTLIGLFFLTATAISQNHDRTLMGYWHNWGTEYRLTDIPDDYNVIVIAFASTSFNGTNSFTPYYDVTTFKADIATVQSEGKKVLISIGGESGSFTLTSTEYKNNFVQSMKTMVEEYNFDGLDVDLEGTAMQAIGDPDFKNPTSTTSINFLAAIDEVLTYFGSNFVLTAAPESYYVQRAYQGLDANKGAFLPFLHRFHDRIDFLAVQLYNTGEEYGLDNLLHESGTLNFLVSQTDMLIHGIPVGGFQSIWDDKEWLAGFDPNQILIGLPSSASAAGSGQVTDIELNDALDALIFGKKTEDEYDLVPSTGHSNLGGLMTWSINWDKDERSYGFADNFTTYFNSISVVNFNSSIDFGNTELGRNFSLDFPITNLAATDEVITISDIPDGFTVSDNNFTVLSGANKIIQIEFEPKSLGTLNTSLTLELSISGNSIIDISAETGCFTSWGISEDFSNGLSDKWTTETEQFQFSVINQELVIDINKDEALWDWIALSFPKADLSTNPNISFDLSSDKDVEIRIELENADGLVTNLNSTDGNLAKYIYGTEGGPKHFEIDFTDLFKQWYPNPFVLEVDPSNIVSIRFMPNHNTTFTGQLIIDNLIIGDDTIIEYPAEATICSNDTYLFGTQTLSAINEGINKEIFTSRLGCDSLVVLNLIVNQSSTSTDIQTSCNAFTWIDGITYTESNNTAIFNQSGSAANGCDNLVTLDFTFTGTTSTDVQTSCESYTWLDGITYTESNNTATFNQAGGATNGCDNLVTLDLTVNNSTTSTDVHTACDSYIWIDGITYTQSNNTATFNQVGEATNGCDNLVTLDLTLNSSITSTDVQTACESYIWIDGITYTENNNTATFKQVGVAANGCDNLVTLDLTINNNTISTDEQMTCESYTWIDGVTYTESNNTATFNQVGSGANGCNNLVTLDLTIQSVDASVTVSDLDITANALGATYQWIDCKNNNAIMEGETNQTLTIPSDGEYAVIVTENGCSATSDCVAIKTTITGIDDELQANSLSLYPNPSKEYFILDIGTKSRNTLVTVFNSKGIQVIQKRFEHVNEEITISTKSLKTGFYMVSIQIDNSSLIRKQLIIE